MRIGIDAGAAVCSPAPKGDYSRRVINTLAEERPDLQLQLYTPRLPRHNHVGEAAGMHNVHFALPAPSGFQGILWRLFGISNCLQPDKVDLFHGTENILPLNIASGHVPSVLSWHEAGSNASNPIARKINTYLTEKSIAAATRIIVESETAKLTLIEKHGASADKIDVTIPSEDPREYAAQLHATYLKAISGFARKSS